MTTISDPEFNRLEETRSDLHESLEASRRIVRRSRVLIELCESAGPLAANDDEQAPFAD